MPFYQIQADDSSWLEAPGAWHSQMAYWRVADGTGPCHSNDCCVDSHCSPGTLFRWSDAPDKTGGPNLDEPLVTDRPDFTEASSTVGQGVVQIESGYTYVSNNDDGQRNDFHSFGELLLRAGVYADWLELRVALSPGQQLTQFGDFANTTTGLSDLYLGLKLGLTPQDGLRPEMALIPQMFVPTGSAAFTSSQVEPGLNLIYGWEINDYISTAGSTQGNRRLDDDDEPFLQIAQSWTVAYTLTDKLGAYTEWFGLFPHSSQVARPQNYFDGGFKYLINNDIQFDIRAGVGLNAAVDDFFVGSGLSIRFP